MTTDTHNKNKYEGKYHIMTQLTRIAQFDNLNRLCLKEPFAVINSDPHWASQFNASLSITRPNGKAPPNHYKSVHVITHPSGKEGRVQDGKGRTISQSPRRQQCSL